VKKEKKWSWADLGVSPKLEKQMKDAKKKGVKLIAPPNELIEKLLKEKKKK